MTDQDKLERPTAVRFDPETLRLIRCAVRIGDAPNIAEWVRAAAAEKISRDDVEAKCARFEQALESIR